MAKIVISENVSLDGVIQDPAGDEGFSRGGWVGRVGDRGREGAVKVLLDEVLGAEAQLLGRRSYEFLAARWPFRSGELADRLNSMPKYVVSSTLEDPKWNNTTVLQGDVVTAVSKLKQALRGEIVVAASFQLVRTLIEHDLVDEVRLMVYPVVLGAGEHLFGETSDKKPMRLVKVETVGDLAHLIYASVGNEGSVKDWHHAQPRNSTTGDSAMAAPTDQMTSFTYTTYIRAASAQVWQGLTDPAITKRYWRHKMAGPKTFRSDWKKGSTYDLAHEEVGLVVSDPGQVILESDPYRQLSYTWHSFTPEWAAEVGMDEATADAWRAEPRSKVAFDIEDVGKGVVKLTVVHDGFSPGSAVLQGISQGWPAVLSSLKTLLETGTALSAT